jgi:uncharacterized membrane protein YGL010W
MRVGREGRFQGLASAFRACHREPLNAVLHLLTTPLGLLCFLSLLWRVDPAAPLALVAAYLVSLLVVLPWRLWAVTALVLALLLYMSWDLALGLPASLAGLAICYFGQDLAHYLTGEPTFQSGYEKRPSWLRQLLEHTYYLLPLCLDAARRSSSGSPPRADCFARA